MAPLPHITDTYRCAFKWSGYNAVNVMHIHAASSTPSIVGDMISSSVTNGMWGAISNTIHVATIDITPLDSLGATFTYATDGTAKWQGSQSGDTIPGSAACVSMKTVERGRSNRGRVYLGPIGEACQVNGTLDNTQRNSWVSAWTAFGVSIISHDGQHVVASYKNATALTVVNYTIRPACATVRRRQDRIAG